MLEYPTIRSHRLIDLAKEQGKQDEMVEELFYMYYQEGKRLNSIPDLVAVANKVGITGNTEDFLKSNEKEDENLLAAQSSRRRAQGVPTFSFSRPDRPDQKPIVSSGGLPPSSFERVFRHLQSLRSLNSEGN